MNKTEIQDRNQDIKEFVQNELMDQKNAARHTQKNRGELADQKLEQENMK